MAESIQFVSPESYFKNFYPHTCIYSWNGAGKTSFAGRSGLRTILLDCGDSGAITLRSVPTVKIVKIKTIGHYLEVMDKVMQMVDKFDLLTVDTLTGLQAMAIREVKGKKGEMSQRKWGSVGSKVIECLSETRSFPKDIIYLAQEKRKNKQDEEGTVQLISPSLTPGVREYLSSCVDWVGRLYIEDGKRKLSFVLTDEIEAKDRMDLFPKTLSGLPREKAYLSIRKRIIDAVHT